MTPVLLSQKLKLFLISCVLLIFIIPLYANPTLTINSYTKNIDFSDNPIVNIIKGDNQNYKNSDFNDSNWEIISLPSDWSSLYPDYNGISWYRIHIQFPNYLPQSALGISLGTITDTDETYFNGVLIGSSGSIDNPRDAAYDKKRLYGIPTALIKPGEDNVLAIRVKGIFSYANGPFTGSFIIGNYAELLTNLFSNNFLKLFLVVIYYIVALYFLLFFARRVEEKENLFFALFSLAMGTYFALRTQGKYFIDTDFFTLKKIEYLILAIVVPLLLEFLMKFFKKKHNIFHLIFFSISTVNFLIFLFSNSYLFWDKYNQLIQVPVWAMGVTLIFIVLISKLRKELDARLIFYAIIILLITLINDIMLNMAVYQFIQLTSYGFLFMVIAIALILSNRFVRLNKEVEELNINLEHRVNLRTQELNNTVIDLEAAKSETDTILQNVNEGIFILDHDLIIGEHHSKNLGIIFNKKELGGVNVIDFLSDIIDQKTADQTNDFLQIALTKKLAKKRLDKLNPIDEIKFKLTIEDKLVDKIVRFNFDRIGKKGNYTHLLGTVEDITEEKLLERKIFESEQQAKDEMQMLMEILHVDPFIIRTFIEEVEKDINDVDKKLESAKFTKKLTEILNSVFRSVHSIKGNSSVLGLDMFTQKAHQFEEQIETLLKKEDLIALDLMDLLYSIVGIKKSLDHVKTLMNKLSDFSNEFSNENKVMDNNQLIIKAAKELALRVAERESKFVDVKFNNFNIPEKYNPDFSMLKKIILQLVKNAVSHGIESPSDRAATGKNRKGKIIISSNIDDNYLKITVQDDGKGLQLEKLRAKAITSGLHTEEDLKGWSNQKLAALLFETGLSTQTSTTIDSGRGMGMDIVKHEVKQAGGKISLSYIPNKRTTFSLSFPLNNRKKL